MCLTVLALPRRNPGIARDVRVVPSRRVQIAVAVTGAVMLTAFLAVHIWKDVTAQVDAWYFHSTPLWLAVMAIGTLIYVREVRGLRRRGVDVDALFSTLPPE
jgi:hypothetical protein